MQKSALQRSRLSLDSPRLADSAAISVQAPAGFGKTHLLAQWRRESLARGAIVAWLTLDDRDDGYRLAQGLYTALAMGSGRSAAPPPSVSMIGQEPGELEGLTGWLAEVADMARETLLILDEVHTLSDASVRHCLTYLLRNAPANLRVVMASRSRLALPMADLLANGQFAMITGEDLRFTVEETLELLTSRFANRLDPDSCLRLYEITEGWPLGLQLSIASLERHADPQQAIAELAVCGGDIQRYFVDSLLSRLAPEQAEFLYRIAPFEMVSPALCTAVLEDPRAATWLEELCATTPLMIEGVNSEWVRIHPLAHELLRARFAELPEAERLQLHRRAAAWLSAQGQHEEAARQALSAGMFEQAYAQAEDSLYEIMLRGRFGRVLEWLERIPEAEVLRRPHLRLAAAWSLALTDRQDEALRLVEGIASDPQAGIEERCEATIIAAAAAYFADRPEQSIAIITPWLKCPPDSLKLRAILANHEARVALWQGQLERVRHCCMHAPHYQWAPGLDAIGGFREWLLGLSYWWEGRMNAAEQALRQSLDRADQDIGRRSAVAVTLATALAAALLEQDRPQEAETVLANRLDILARLAAPEAVILGYLTSARLAFLHGHSHRAVDLLEELFALGESRHLPRFCIISLSEQIRQHALRGHAQTCLSLWRRLDALLPDVVRTQTGVLGAELALPVAMARINVALAQQSDWAELLPLLEQAGQLAERLRRGRESVQVKLLQATVRQKLGQDGSQLLHEALGLAEELGLRRVLSDTHPDLADWVAKQGGALPQSAPAAANETAAQASRPGKPVSVSPSQLLTPKEQQVLQLLARNLTNKQIALALNVGEETVKWHIKNLFGKFQAGTRKHVVDRAYLLGILGPNK
ncbi:LuxR C-terminal-related transcriptional regulator [Pseudomonas aeruginosa]